jgi:uncharacterized protein (DUF952 family)
MIVHLCQNADWIAAQIAGEYRTGSLEQDGFIHCSTQEQILIVANHFYESIPDILLLWIDPSRLQSEVRWEPPAHLPTFENDCSNPVGQSDWATEKATQAEGAELFPHVYGPINLDAVKKVMSLSPDSDGVFRRYFE